MASCSLIGELTTSEIEAANAYGAEATYFHAAKQGWSGVFSKDPALKEFLKTAKAHQEGLDSAIKKCRLDEDAALYTGHGLGFTARGCLDGDAARFVGLTYRYPGYISTSAAEATAVGSFLSKRSYKGSLPTLLALRLPKAFNVLDMNRAGVQGEFEFLVGREVEFNVIQASYFDVNGVVDRVLRLVCEPH